MKSFVYAILDYLIPQSWKKPMAIALIFGALGVSGSAFIRYIVLTELEASTQAISDSKAVEFNELKTKFHHQEQTIIGIKGSLDAQATKIDRMDGKMDTVIYLLKHNNP